MNNPGYRARIQPPQNIDAGIPEPQIPAYLEQRPRLLEWSSWSQTYDHLRPTPQRRLGGFAMGNGCAFSLSAMRVPFTTLHNMTGPNYQLEHRFFSDKTLLLKRGRRNVQWRIERAWRVRGTSVNLIEQQADGLSLWTIDFAPQGQGIDSGPAVHSLVRRAIVYNHGTETLRDLSLVLQTTLGEASGDMLTESLKGESRNLAAGCSAPDELVHAKGRSLVVDVGDLRPSEEYAVTFYISFALDSDAAAVLEAVKQMNADELLEETVGSWEDWLAEGSRIATSNERFNDLLETVLITIRNQQDRSGGVTEMSRYSYTWLRDIMGPARLYPLVGRIDDYRCMLDYYWLAALYNGDIKNALPVDISGPPAPEPDWENLTIGRSREAAESVSYLILHYKYYFLATGNWEPIRQRYGMLRHALIHQDLRHGCLLPFSDDETFRGALAVALGLWAANSFQRSHLSANSSFLFVQAAEFMQQAALHLGYEDHAEEYRQLAESVRQCAEEHYWLEQEGFYAPLLEMKSLEPVRQPFLDINTKPLWTGYLEPDDPKAEANLLNTVDLLANEQGMAYSPLDPDYLIVGSALGVHKGIMTGMSYGYYLDNLAQMDHPEAERVFLLFDSFFHSSGVVSEYQVADDFGRLVYFYGDRGWETDMTAGYRSWEAGINAAAMLQYLFGLSLDAPNNRIAIAPHLPQGWEYTRIEHCRLADTTFDLSVQDKGDVRLIEVDNASGPLQVDAILSVRGEIGSISVNGQPVSADVETKWGRQRADLPPLTVDRGEPLVIEVIRSE